MDQSSVSKETKSVKITQPEHNIYVPVDLIKNMRNILDVVNSRVHWKSNELLPMGILIKQLDDIIASIQ